MRWERQGTGFLKGQYSREHTWSFDGGITVLASAYPHLVPAPYSNSAHVDPEEIQTMIALHALRETRFPPREAMPR